MVRTAELLAVALLVALAAGCASSPRSCSSASACGSGACHAGRCGGVDDVPVPPTSRRVTLSPIALRTSETARYVATFGGPGSSPALFVRFPATSGRGRIERAFLVLTPAPGAPASATATTISVARALEAWSPTSAEPRVGPIEATTSATFAPPRTIRVDVTELVREWARGGDPQHGLVVRAAGGGEVGVSLAIEADEAPRLDLYVSGEKPR